mmetsp:Transcript_54146/g.116266  ORF Transcript_54146/g.116266 Transcript_54146/m.116266 type:complete len:104 (+) Transcript_54146:1172-1483(+)
MTHDVVDVAREVVIVVRLGLSESARELSRSLVVSAEFCANPGALVAVRGVAGRVQFCVSEGSFCWALAGLCRQVISLARGRSGISCAPLGGEKMHGVGGNAQP